MELIIGAISALGALIGAVWGIVKYYDQKRTKEQEKKEAREEERYNQLADIYKVAEKIHQGYEAQHKEIVKLQQDVSHIKEQIIEVNTKIDQTQETMNENEMDRLRSDIINCVDKIENGFSISEADLLHIHHDYDKYSSNGGNSYIESCMDFVREYEQECREAGLFGDENNTN